MDTLLLVVGAVAVLTGVATLVFRFKPRNWRHSPPWVFAGMLFSFGVVFLSWAAQRQLELFSSLEWLLFLFRMAGFGGVIVFALIGRKNQRRAG